MTDNDGSDALFQQGIDLTRRGDYSGAIPILREAAALKRASGDHREIEAISVYLGYTYWQWDRLDQAVEWFQRATGNSPESEKASLGLFHCLWEIGSQSLALDEMKRFLRIKKSNEYEEILKTAIPVIGTQSYTNRDFGYEEMIEALKEVIPEIKIALRRKAMGPDCRDG
jgi:tetratricopeptide (TPR) repeat protein